VQVERAAPRASEKRARSGGGASSPAEEVPVSRERRSRERAAPVPADVELSPGDAVLLAALKTLRGGIARDEKLPAYCVFPDRTLLEMAVRRPRSLVALSDVRGVGPAKLDKYGERFLAVIRGANDTEAA
jgi:ATP-dependent DNA helicase RecQ